MSSAIEAPPGQPAYQIVREKYPKPDSRESLVQEIRRILDRGGVQRLQVVVGQGIHVVRKVPLGPEEVPAETPESELMAAARNADAEVLPYKGSKDPYSYLFRAFDVLTRRRLAPRAFMAKKQSFVKKWLGIDPYKDMQEVFGVPVITDPEVEPDALLLLGCSPDDPEYVSFGLRLEMDLPEEALE